MGLNTFTINFSDLARKRYVYFSYKFQFYNIEIQKTRKYLKSKVSDYFDIFTGYAFKSKDYEDGGAKLLRIGDFDKYGDIDTQGMACLPEEYFEIYKRFEVKKEDIVIALTGATIGKTAFVENFEENILLNQRVGLMRVKNENIKPKLFYLLTKLKYFQFQIQIDSMGKGQQNISPTDVSKIKIPLITKPKQDLIVAKIEPIEKKIKELKAQIIQQQEIINKIFVREFGFDLENANEKKRNMIHYSSLVDVANEELKFDISLKYRFIFNKYVKNPSKNEWIELGKIVEVKGGKRLPKGQNITEEDTGFKYVRVEDLNWSGIFDLENIKYISEKNHIKIKNYISNEYDILLTIVGATVGKCGLVPLELDGANITENFARLIILDKEEYLPEYVNYCLQSKTSAYQIDEYKGRSSQGKLALFRIKKIKIPNIKPELQQKIVDEIKAESVKQEKIKDKIESERNKIDEIIEAEIFSSSK